MKIEITQDSPLIMKLIPETFTDGILIEGIAKRCEHSNRLKLKANGNLLINVEVGQPPIVPLEYKRENEDIIRYSHKEFQLVEYSFKEFRRHFKAKYPGVQCSEKGGVNEMLTTIAKVGLSVKNLCDYIRQAPGNRAEIIYYAKRHGWWEGDACEDIRQAPGNGALAIYRAKRDGWWEGDACEDIRKVTGTFAPGDLVWAIHNAKRDGWWKRRACETVE